MNYLSYPDIEIFNQSNDFLLVNNPLIDNNQLIYQCLINRTKNMYQSTFCQCVLNNITHLEGNIDIIQLSDDITISTIMTMAFGIDDYDLNQDMLNSINFIIKEMVTSSGGNYLLNYLPYNLKFKRHQEELKCIIEEIIIQKEEDIDIIEDDPDLMVQLIDQGCSSEEIVDLVIPLIIGLFYTCSTYIPILLYQLSNNSQLQKRIQAEAMTIDQGQIMELNKLALLDSIIFNTDFNSFNLLEKLNYELKETITDLHDEFAKILIKTTIKEIVLKYYLFPMPDNMNLYVRFEATNFYL